MSIGLAIFLSALMLIIAWQIDKRGGWRRFGRVLLWLVAIGCVGGGLIGVYVWWDNSRDERQKQADLAIVAKDGIDTYWNIRIGSKTNEVIYKKGEPAERKDEVDSNYWLYKNESTLPSEQYDAYVIWNGKGRVASVVCVNGSGCPTIEDIGYDSPEEEVRARFGIPRLEEEPSDKGIKTLNYGKPDRELFFLLNLGKVIGIGIGSRDDKKEIKRPASE